ncbi:MAG: hypothetical protein P4N59_18260 [Negativicutes bacterium]|nr:hypothetical protein [Negativicutes bacterium]
MGGGGSTNQTTNQTTEPYSGEYQSWLYPVKDQIFGNLANGAQPYGGQLNYGLTGAQQSAINGFQQAADSPLLSDTISGKYLDPSTNPYIQGTYNDAAQNVLKGVDQMNDKINGQFGQNGLYNSSARRTALQSQANTAGQQLSSLANQIYGGNYSQERGYQLQALGAQQQMLGNLLNAGGVEQQTGQAGLNNNYQEWLRQMGVDDNNLNQAMNFLSLVKNPSSTQTTTATKSK